jgi:hypothetical protein
MAFPVQMLPRSRSLIMFRIAMLLLASALAAFSIWILLPEASRSGVHRLPTNAEAATAAAAVRARAGRAARLGAIRGDLWAEFAFTYAAPIWPGTEPGTDPLAVANEARAYPYGFWRPCIRMFSPMVTSGNSCNGMSA